MGEGELAVVSEDLGLTLGPATPDVLLWGKYLIPKALGGVSCMQKHVMNCKIYMAREEH